MAAGGAYRGASCERGYSSGSALHGCGSVLIRDLSFLLNSSRCASSCSLGERLLEIELPGCASLELEKR